MFQTNIYENCFIQIFLIITFHAVTIFFLFSWNRKGNRVRVGATFFRRSCFQLYTVSFFFVNKLKNSWRFRFLSEGYNNAWHRQGHHLTLACLVKQLPTNPWILYTAITIHINITKTIFNKQSIDHLRTVTSHRARIYNM